VDERKYQVPGTNHYFRYDQAMNFNDFSSTEFFENPYPLYEKIRGAGPFVLFSPNAFITGRMSIVEPLLRDRGMRKNYMPGVIVRYAKARHRSLCFRRLAVPS
jgi:cytochrome P450